MNEELTIFTSTLNRHNFLNKLLLYYQNYGFKGKILIGDSTDDNFKSNKFTNLDYEIYKYSKKERQIDIYFDLIKKVNTKFAVYTGDDDFLILNKINNILSTINDKSTIVNLGYIALFINNNFSPTHLSCPFYSVDLHSMSQINYKNYQEIYTKKYRSLMFTIASAEKWLYSIELSKKFKSRAVGGEIAMGAHLLTNSNFRISNEISLVRLQHENLYTIHEDFESKIERILLGREILNEEIQNYKIKDIYTSGPSLISFRKSIINSGYNLNEIEPISNVIKILKNDLLINKNLSIIYWGNKSTINILINFLKKFSGEKFVLIHSKDYDFPEDIKNSLLENNIIELIAFHPYIRFEEIDQLKLLINSLSEIKINHFISISHDVPVEKYLIKKLRPKKVILIWPHMTNLINYPKFCNYIENNNNNNLNIFQRIYFINKKEMIVDIINTINAKFNNFGFLVYREIILQNKKSGLYNRKLDLKKSNFTKNINNEIKLHIKKSNFLMNFHKVIRNNFITSLFIVILSSLLMRANKLISYIYKNLIYLKKLNLDNLLIFDYILKKPYKYSLIDVLFRNNISPYSYFCDQTQSILRFKVIGYILLNQKLNFIFSNDYLFQLITQIGNLTNSEIYVFTNYEKHMLSKIYPNNEIKMINFKRLNIINTQNNLIQCLLTISVGLLPTINIRNSFLEEIKLFILNKKIDILIIRKHPAENENLFIEFLEFLKDNLNIIIQRDNNNNLKDSLLRTNYLLSTVSGVLTEIEEVDHNKIYVLKILSSLQYKDLNLFLKFYPKVNLI